jgi:hypothetical protein
VTHVETCRASTEKISTPTPPCDRQKSSLLPKHATNMILCTLPTQTHRSASPIVSFRLRASVTNARGAKKRVLGGNPDVRLYVSVQCQSTAVRKAPIAMHGQIMSTSTMRRFLSCSQSSAVNTTSRYHHQRSIKTLALTCQFKNPDLGMKEYDYLSSSACFLLEVNNIHDNSQDSSTSGDVKNKGWLQFIPRELRPSVHVVVSSHVVAPFLWREYFPQPWLTTVKSEHWYENESVYKLSFVG